MATITPERQRVTLTIPAENVDDFRVGLLADLKCDAEGFGVEHQNMLDARGAWRGTCRKDRDGRIRGIRETSELVHQLPVEDVEAVVSGTVEALRFALEAAGQLLADRVRREFDYCPVPVENVFPLLDRLRWTVEQVATIEQGA
ncbi:MAG: hypothetical protein ACR2IP_05870 [Solirubrobacteraceae bacterium]